MPSYQANEKLSFDALGHIFSYYAEDETILHPLETLLLVCKAWSDAALGHLTLWNNLRIYIRHEETYRIWSARLPLRLARCGPEIPLDIDLRYFLETRYWDDDQPPRPPWDDFLCNPGPGGWLQQCRCKVLARAFVTRALEIMTGLNGSQCARWRSLTLDLGTDWYPQLWATLSYPTPILQNLVLKNTSIGVGTMSQQLFPNATRVKTLSLFQCYLPSLPSCEESLVEATFKWAVPNRGYQNLSLLGRATQLQHLSLRLTPGIDVLLPARLDHLRVLEIEGALLPLPQALHTCQMPMLSWLVLEIQGGTQIDNVLECVGLPLATLSRLTFTMNSMRFSGEHIGPLTLESVSILLRRLKKLESLEGNAAILSMVIWVMWHENDVGAAAEATTNLKHFSISHMQSGDTVKLDGTETAPFFEELAERWGCMPPNVPLHEFIELALVF